MVALPVVRIRLRIAALIGVATLLQQACGEDNAPLSVDTAPPIVVLAPASTNVTSPGHLGLTATADDDVGVTRVEFYERLAANNEDPTKIGEDASRHMQSSGPF